MAENKKIKGATVTKIGNITFRSKLEAKVAKTLEDNNISYQYENTKLMLLPSILYNNKLYRSVHYTPDFICGDFIIEVKGYPNDVWPLKKKIIINHLVNTNSNYKFREVKNLKELNEVIKEIKDYESYRKNIIINQQSSN